MAYDVAVVGTGFSGICMGVQLKQAGYESFVMFEEQSQIGGVWRDNVYPGCACDIPAPLYSYSFAQHRHWSQLYSPQPEIWRYLFWVVERYKLKPHLKMGTRITALRLDEGAGLWHLTSAAGEAFVARAVVVAAGGLSVPSIPAVPGLPAFKGTTFHSAAWDSTIDLAGKRVAVIGTGASAIQVIPSIQPLVGRLFVFQRSPAWVLPRRNQHFTARQRAAWWWPLWLLLLRLGLFLVNELVVGLSMVHNNTFVLRQIAAVGRAHLRRQVPDEQLRQQLAPSYSVGCKRILTSDDYYPAMAHPNVQLITSGLAQVKDGSTLVAQDGTEVEGADVIIFSTGFDMAGATGRLQITGAGGTSLRERWAQHGPQAYLGAAVAGFPNLFCLLGPNTALGHNSIIFLIECQVKFILKLLAWMRSSQLKCVEVTAAAQQAFNQRLQQKLRGSVWLTGCSSWYLDGRGGSGFVLWSGLCLDYWWETLYLRRGDFRTVGMQQQQQKQQQQQIGSKQEAWVRRGGSGKQP